MLLRTTVIQWPYQTGLISPIQKSKFLGQVMHYSKSSFLGRRDYPQDAGLPGVCLCWARAHTWSNPSRGGSTQQSHIWRGCHGAISSLQPCALLVPDSDSEECLTYIRHNPQSSRNGNGKEKFQSLDRSFSSSPTAPTANFYSSSTWIAIFSTQNINYLWFTSTVFRTVWIKHPIKSSLHLFIKRNSELSMSSSKGS